MTVTVTVYLNKTKLNKKIGKKTIKERRRWLLPLEQVVAFKVVYCFRVGCYKEDIVLGENRQLVVVNSLSSCYNEHNYLCGKDKDIYTE